MAKQRAWVLWLFAGICFSFAGVMNLIDKKYTLGAAFIFLGLVYFVLCIANYKNRNKPNEIILSDKELDKLNKELRALILENKKIEAIKRYRMATGLGLKEAKEYVDALK